MIEQIEKQIESILLNEQKNVLNELDLDLRKHLDFFKIGDAGDERQFSPKAAGSLNYKKFICKYLSLSKDAVNTDQMRAELDKFPPKAQEKILDLYFKLSDNEELAKKYCLGAKKEISRGETTLVRMKAQAERDKENLLTLAANEPKALLSGISRELVQLGFKRDELIKAIKYVLPLEVWRMATQQYSSQKALGGRRRALPPGQLAESQIKRFKKLSGII